MKKNTKKSELVNTKLNENNKYQVIDDNSKTKLNIDTVLPDTSAIIEGFISRSIESKKLVVKTIMLHEAMIAELESQANKNRETGYLGLEELIRIQNLAKEKNIKLEIIGERPNEFEIKQAKSGEIDNLIRYSAESIGATLITGDIVQSLVAKAKAIPVVLLNLSDQIVKSSIYNYFDEETMSVHLKTKCIPKAKKGFPGNWDYVEINNEPLTSEELIELSKGIVEEANARDDSFIEIQRKGSTIVQLGNIRIVITKPPFSETYEITAVRPIKKLLLSEYEISEKLMKRFEEQAEGVLISGAPGQGKSTFAQALAEFYNAQGKVVKTVEAPRDLILSDDITQYAISHGSNEEIHDVLLLSRPDYTFFDEMRNYKDFQLFSDMRLSGVGMLGVIHATKTIDAIQRFIGRIELGVIPHIIDTVIFIQAGRIANVYSVNMQVKVPSGMKDSDLARPVICVNDFETGKLEFEIYTYGEQTVVIPVSEEEIGAVEKLAEKTLTNYFKQIDSKAKVELNGKHRCTVYVSKKTRPAIIGRDGETIQRIEKEIGLSVDIKLLDDIRSTSNSTSKSKTVESSSLNYDYNLGKDSISIQLDNIYQNKEVNVFIDNDFLMTAKVSKKAKIKISKKNKLGKIIQDALRSNSLSIKN